MYISNIFKNCISVVQLTKQSKAIVQDCCCLQVVRVKTHVLNMMDLTIHYDSHKFLEQYSHHSHNWYKQLQREQEEGFRLTDNTGMYEKY